MKKEKIIKLGFYILASPFVLPIGIFIWPAAVVILAYNHTEELEMEINPMLAYCASIGSVLVWLLFLAWVQGNLIQ